MSPIVTPPDRCYVLMVVMLRVSPGKHGAVICGCSSYRATISRHSASAQKPLCHLPHRLPHALPGIEDGEEHFSNSSALDLCKGTLVPRLVARDDEVLEQLSRIGSVVDRIAGGSKHRLVLGHACVCPELFPHQFAHPGGVLGEDDWHVES